MVAAVVTVIADAIWRNPTEAAAIATAAALGVIAYQSWQTRLATESAELGLAMAERSLRVSQSVAVEAEKSRLDQRAPRIAIERKPVYWPPFGPSPLSAGMPPAQFDEGRIFRMPGQGSEILILRADGTVRNEGPWSVRVHFNNAVIRQQQPQHWDDDDELPWEPSRPEGYEKHLAPGESVDFRVEEPRTVGEWVENARARLQGKPAPMAIHAEIIVPDDFDNGVIDNFRIELGGCPLNPVHGETESWQIPACFPHNVPIYFTVFALSRQYYRSKRKAQKLPEISFDSQAETD